MEAKYPTFSNFQELFSTKDKYQKNLAELPFEKKIKILIKLQKLAMGFPSRSNKKRIVWNIDAQWHFFNVYD